MRIDSAGAIRGAFFAPSATGITQVRLVTQDGNGATDAVLGHVTALAYRRSDITALCPDVPVAAAGCLPDAALVEDFTAVTAPGTELDWETYFDYGAGPSAMGGYWFSSGDSTLYIVDPAETYNDHPSLTKALQNGINRALYLHDAYTLAEEIDRHFWQVFNLPATIGVTGFATDYDAYRRGYVLAEFTTVMGDLIALLVRDGAIRIITNGWEDAAFTTNTITDEDTGFVWADYAGLDVRLLCVWAEPTLVAPDVHECTVEFFLDEACNGERTSIGAAQVRSPYSEGNLSGVSLGWSYDTYNSGTAIYREFATDTDPAPFVGL